MAERFPDFEIQETQQLKENSENQDIRKSTSTWLDVWTCWAEKELWNQYKGIYREYIEWSLRASGGMRAVYLFLRARAFDKFFLRAASTLENRKPAAPMKYHVVELCVVELRAFSRWYTQRLHNSYRLSYWRQTETKGKDVSTYLSSPCHNLFIVYT